MANKEDKLRGGLNALFGSSEPQQNQSTEEATESSSPQMEVEPTTAQDEEDLLNTIEDEELREALRQKRNSKRGRPRTTRDANGNPTNGYTRTSLVVNMEKWAKLKEISFRETLTIKEVLEAALDMAIEKYESTHGTIEPHPEKYKGDATKLFK